MNAVNERESEVDDDICKLCSYVDPAEFQDSTGDSMHCKRQLPVDSIFHFESGTSKDAFVSVNNSNSGWDNRRLILLIDQVRKDWLMVARKQGGLCFGQYIILSLRTKTRRRVYETLTNNIPTPKENDIQYTILELFNEISNQSTSHITLF